MLLNCRGIVWCILEKSRLHQLKHNGSSLMLFLVCASFPLCDSPFVLSTTCTAGLDTVALDHPSCTVLWNCSSPGSLYTQCATWLEKCNRGPSSCTKGGQARMLCCSYPLLQPNLPIWLECLIPPAHLR